MALKTTTTTTLKTANTTTLKTTFTATITTTTTTAVTMTLKIILFFFFLTAFLSFTTQETIKTRLNMNNNFSLSFPLTSRSLSPQTYPKFYSSFVALTKPNTGKKAAPSLNYRSKFRYSMALIVSLPIGTPPQTQEMVLNHVTHMQLNYIIIYIKL
ncbi:hypothetical protein Patl1_21167 [Pistacia atlantica]|uniref:Uncharacterized protein n=1 Tax=Pistacia atlantica TaxID=434234 RepID=A0ACC1BJ39_9ROSI|nr:hypothetical protein Patl1_21167 [Pistacia atlantica]